MKIGVAAGAMFIASISSLAQARAAVDCPYDPMQHLTAQHIRAEASRRAEIIAPTAAASSKRRSVSISDLRYPPARNFIDTEIFGKMKRDKIMTAPVSGDAEFLRRVTIDLVGRIPTSAEVNAFLADTTADKRDRAIDRLLQSDELNDRWTLWFGDLVQNVEIASAVGQGVGAKGRTPYYHWIRNSFASRKSYDTMVRELITSSGEQRASGAANYLVRLFQENGPPQDTFDNVATQAGSQFLALPLMCVSCHDGASHLELVNFGLSRVKRSQLWGLAAFFARVRIELKVPAGEQYPTWDVSEAPAGDYLLNTTSGNKSARQPRSGDPEAVAPVYLDGGTPLAGENRRNAFARLLTADRQFARAAVNYLWKEMFGLGIVEPAGEFDLAKLDRQASHPALLEQLADAFISSGYDVRALLRLMATSNAYQLSMRYPGAWDESFTPYFARRYPRRLMAEVLLDAIYAVTGRTMNLDVTLHGKVTRAVAVPDPVVLLNHGFREGSFLSDFGQGDRDSIARSTEPSLLQTLTLLNDKSMLLGTIGSGLVRQVVGTTNDLGEIAERIFVGTLSRPPTAAEKGIAVEFLKGGTSLTQRGDDLQFALMHKLEFLFY